MELLNTQELSEIKGGKWMYVNGEWIWVDETR